MKTSIIFHSVSGNTYLCAREIYKAVASCSGAENVDIYRVEDRKIDYLKNDYPIIAELYDEINSVKLASNSVLLESDFIIMGSPTYFGNVSSQLKDFLDDTAVFWESADLFGKKFLSFTTAGNSQGGADICLKTLNNYASHMGMIPYSVPSNLEIKMPAYGLVHFTGTLSDQRPCEDFKRATNECIKKLLHI